MPELKEENSGNSSSIATDNPNDGRTLGDWKSRYESEAWNKIWFEVAYLALLFVATLIALYFVWQGSLNNLLLLQPDQYSKFTIFVYGSLGGLLGGTLNGMKWLYHSVARAKWNYDRRIWRILTPILSCGLALVMISLIRSELVSALNSKSVEIATTSFTIGFLVGFFSDSAIAKLAEVAQTLFGVASKNSK